MNSPVLAVRGERGPLFSCLIAAICAAILGLAISTNQAVAAPYDTTYVSRGSALDGFAASDISYDASVSADGRFIAFASAADNLSSIDDDRAVDIFVRDTVNGTTTLVSRGNGLNGGPPADESSETPSISADGRFVAFASYANNLSNQDNDSKLNIFVRDTLTNSTKLVSRADGAAGDAADDFSEAPSISADGSIVAFSSYADNLDTDAMSSVVNIFVRNVITDTTRLVSRATGFSGAVATGSSYRPSISANGRVVGFSSSANNLSAADDNGCGNVFLRNLADGTTRLVNLRSHVVSGLQNCDSEHPSLSEDGRFVAFASYDTGLVAEPIESSDWNIYLRDMRGEDRISLVNRASGQLGAVSDNDAFSPSISGDGQRVAFESGDYDLVGDEGDVSGHVYVRDVASGVTGLASRASGEFGVAGDGSSGSPAISQDGKFVAFTTNATNFSRVDDRSSSDVFEREIGVLRPLPPKPFVPQKSGGGTATPPSTNGGITGPGPDRTPPAVSVVGKFSKVDLHKLRHGVVARVVSSELGSVRVSASLRLSIKGKQQVRELRLPAQNVGVKSALSPRDVSFRVTKRLIARVKLFLRSNKRARASIAYSAQGQDLAGNASAQAASSSAILLKVKKDN